MYLPNMLNNDVPNDNFFETPMQIVAQSPRTPTRDTTGELYNLPTTLNFNPLLEAEFTQSNNYTFRTIGCAYANYHILPSLTLRGEFGGDFTNLTSDRYSGSQSNFGQSVGGYGEAYSARVENYDMKLLLTYASNFSDAHQLEVTGGFEYQPYSQFYSKVDGQGFPNDNLKTLASASQIVYGTSYLTEYRFLSYFARANYSYREKYLFSLTGRLDGSSRFGVEISKKLNIKIISIKDLVAYRMRTERLVVKELETEIESKFGKFKVIAFRQITTGDIHLAFTKGNFKSETPTFVRESTLILRLVIS